jgi:hypothetical protein
LDRFPQSITPKQWCCLFDAISGKAIGRTDDAEAIWLRSQDGAVLHPGHVVDSLVAWGCLVQVDPARWRATIVATAAIQLPVEEERACW